MFGIVSYDNVKEIIHKPLNRTDASKAVNVTISGWGAVRPSAFMMIYHRAQCPPIPVMKNQVKLKWLPRNQLTRTFY
jgi:hypothetical protein